MGMFDYVRCLAPLPDGFQQTDGWQTKDLECTLATYEITADGRLVRARPGSYDVQEEAEVLPHHGDLQFYGGNVCAVGAGFVATADDQEPWSRTYVARFTDGRLTKITGGLDECRQENVQHVKRSEIQEIWERQSRIAARQNLLGHIERVNGPTRNEEWMKPISGAVLNDVARLIENTDQVVAAARRFVAAAGGLINSSEEAMETMDGLCQALQYFPEEVVDAHQESQEAAAGVTVAGEDASLAGGSPGGPPEPLS